MRNTPLAFALLFAAAGARADSLASFDSASSGFAPQIRFVRPPQPAAPVALAARPSAPRLSFNGGSFPAYAFTGQPGGVAASLIEAIDRTQRTLDAAVYNLTLPGLTDALLRAHARGVGVRLVVDEGHLRPDPDKGPGEWGRLIDAKIPMRALRGGGQYGSMHNKFAVFDGAFLESGSFNWTKAAEDNNRENAIFRDDRNLIAGYQAYWDWMWAHARPVGAESEPETARGPPPVDQAKPLLYKGRAWPAFAFSPQGGTEQWLLDSVAAAEKTIDIAMFSFYSQPLAEALVKAKERGVRVRMILDSSQASRSDVVAYLRAQGLKPRLIKGRAGRGAMHHKYAIFDRELLETGSYNWSLNASANNYENTVFSTTPSDLAGFQAEYDELERAAKDAAAAGEITD